MQIQLLSGIYDNPAYMRSYLPVAGGDKEQKRAGILIGAKVDMYNMGMHLRWGYLPQDQLMKYGLSREDAKKLKTELRKAEELYEQTGGSRLQFARAILEGSGNTDGKVKIDYKTLGDVAVSFEEQILQADPKTLLTALKGQVEGLGISILGTLDKSAESVNKASDTLIKIGNIAQSIATITTSLGTQVKSTGTTADIHTTPEKTELMTWFENNKLIAAGGLLALAGFAVTRMNMPKEEKREYERRAKKHGLSGVKRTRKCKSGRNTNRKRTTRSSSNLGIVPLM